MRKMRGWIRSRRLELGTGGGKDTLILVGLGVIIVGALALAVWGIFGGGEEAKTTGTPPNETHLQCLQCGHEWQPTMEELRQYGTVTAAGSTFRAICPSCGAQAGVKMAQCPECGAWYVPNKNKYSPSEYAQYQMQNYDLDDKCPECGLNITEHIRKRRRGEIK